MRGEVMDLNILKLEGKRRDAILNASLKEFAMKGYDDASTNIIAKQANISKALMFHYVSSKEKLFLYLYEYCQELIDKEYFKLMDFNESDIFERLRKSYLLQLELIKKYPWIFDFNKLTSKTKSNEINKIIEEKQNDKNIYCYEVMFDAIDESKFRTGLDVEQCKQLIFWGNVGFTNQILEEIKGTKLFQIDETKLTVTLDNYFNELRKVFYK